MKFLLRKDGTNKVNEITFNELAKKLNLASLTKNIDSLKKKVEELEKRPIVDKQFIMDLIKADFLKSGELLSVANAASVEKMKGLPDGVFYYNKAKNTLRLKTKEGWVSLKGE